MYYIGSYSELVVIACQCMTSYVSKLKHNIIYSDDVHLGAYLYLLGSSLNEESSLIFLAYILYLLSVYPKIQSNPKLYTFLFCYFEAHRICCPATDI